MRFDKSIALAAAGLIQQLYNNELTPTINEPTTDTQVLIRGGGESPVFVVFPGSASRADWATNLRAGKVKGRVAGRVHAGFHEAMESIRTELSARLAGRHYVIIAGHSLGGALATLAADALDAWMPARVGAVYTFGSPRCGNGAFARSYNARLHDQTFRLVTARDPIPRIPWLLGTYRHVGTRVFLDDHGGIEVNPPLWRDWELMSAVDPTTDRPVPEQTAQELISLEAHHIETYIRKLQEGTEV